LTAAQERPPTNWPLTNEAPRPAATVLPPGPRMAAPPATLVYEFPPGPVTLTAARPAPTVVPPGPVRLPPTPPTEIWPPPGPVTVWPRLPPVEGNCAGRAGADPASCPRPESAGMLRKLPSWLALGRWAACAGSCPGRAAPAAAPVPGRPAGSCPGRLPAIPCPAPAAGRLPALGAAGRLVGSWAGRLAGRACPPPAAGRWAGLGAGRLVAGRGAGRLAGAARLIDGLRLAAGADLGAGLAAALGRAPPPPPRAPPPPPPRPPPPRGKPSVANSAAATAAPTRRIVDLFIGSPTVVVAAAGLPVAADGSGYDPRVDRH
jgi:hypothetical protein